MSRTLAPYGGQQLPHRISAAYKSASMDLQKSVNSGHQK